jgi:outer membrane translocation and assembly module TamA
MNSNRAYGYRKLGPKNDKGDPIGSDSIIEATVEYRFPIYGNFKGVVFNDNTFLKSDYMDGYDKGYHSAGFGLRYLTPIGPIAIDFGFDMSNPTSQYAFHFHVGELF